MTAQVTMPEVLWRTDYDRTLALLAVLDRPSAVPPPGGVQGVAPFTFVGDNQAKGISDVPALTLHADPAWSAAHWDDDPARRRTTRCWRWRGRSSATPRSSPAR